MMMMMVVQLCERLFRAASQKRERMSPAKPMKKQHGGRVDAQRLLTRFGRELLWPGYRFMGPGTRLEKRLKRGDKGINRLDHLAKRHDIEYFKAKTNLTHKWKADKRMIQAIDRLPGKKTLTERLVKKVMQAKLLLKL